MDLAKQNGAKHAATKASGLDGVVVADTALSEVDGERGRLVVGGYDVEALAGRVGFEDLCALLWTGALPDAATRGAIAEALAEGRTLAFEQIPSLGEALVAEDGSAALMACVAHFGARAAWRSENRPAWVELARVTGAVATFAAAWARRRAGGAPIAPDAKLGHAADFLRMVRSAVAPEAAARGLDAYLVTVADHGMNASTFTARVVASTGSDLVSAIVAAIGALKGPLHGGAPGPVLDMLDGIGEPSRAAAWIEAELAAGRRIMGMGHRIYRVRDPRAAVLERAIGELERDGSVGAGARLALARATERAAETQLAERHPDRPLKANVEFYTAVLLDAVGLPRELFTPTFAVGRAAGWCAHVEEQRRAGRLIRPASRYVGPVPA
ncbi:citrate synthase [Polyangium jinanense]|uniref:Citrate synthase n=1 Tax=Polyangium jinanense TaxID=2829994 RepID=A0A9X3XGY9_9BACT|nr:citrate synthase [Polyangium jinanense]MDC3958823.1 citrate synthase [Polyangium jinanense]MDC3989185.1 citrate synthase [Polyangium jinanense]